MEIREHVATLQREGEQLASAAAIAPLDSPIPTCPGFQVRDLLRHVGSVHRGVTELVRGGTAGRSALLEDLGVPGPDDSSLLDWFREGHAELVGALNTAPSDLQCWTFFPVPSPLAFWARRQAHETAIHRADMDVAVGWISTYDPFFSADGIDELLDNFASGAGRGIPSNPPRVLHIHADDLKRDWLLYADQAGTTVSREPALSDCAVRGTASDLYLLLWNRRTPDGLAVHGDRGLLDRWRDSVQVRSR